MIFLMKTIFFSYCISMCAFNTKHSCILYGISNNTVLSFYKDQNKKEIENLYEKKYKVPSKCFDIVIDNGDIDFICYIKNIYGRDVFSASQLFSACKKGQFEVVRWFHENTSVNFTKEAMDICLIHGYLDITEWLLSNRLEGCSDNILEQVLEHSICSFKIVNWLLNNSCKITEKSLSLACITGNLDIINMIFDKNDTYFNINYFKEVVKSKNISTILNLSLKYDFKFTNDIRDLCIIYNVFNLLKLKFSTKLLDIDKDIIIDSYLRGNKCLVKWIIKKTGVDYKLFDIASSKGDLEFVIWLNNKNFTGTIRALDNACINGHLLTVKFLSLKRNEGFSEEAVIGALREGHDEVYIWLYENYERVRNNDNKYKIFCKEHSIIYPIHNAYSNL
jgi:hypothetical protein